MIHYLKGKLVAKSPTFVIVEVGGLGYRVNFPLSSYQALPPEGSTVSLYTHLHLREDNATVYGFVSTEELELFKALINVSGLGPRMALTMLSAMNIEQLTMAIATGNAELLTGIPGIGKKMANRLVLELKDKIGAGLITAPAVQLAEENADVLTALTTLGYSVREATRAVATIPPDQELTLEERVKLALGFFATK